MKLVLIVLLAVATIELAFAGVFDRVLDAEDTCNIDGPSVCPSSLVWLTDSPWSRK
jgi:hypothetical protein